jgi:hypothetical protein
VNGNIQRVNPGYVINSAIKNADGVIATYKTRQMTKFNGYLLYKVRKQYIYIDVICAKDEKGVGKTLLDECQKVARENNKSQMRLSALKHVIGYYLKYGFVHSEGGCSMSKNLTELSNKLRNLYVHKADTTALLKKLVEMKLVAKKDCSKIRSHMNVKWNNIIEKCNQDGFSMTFCLNSP